MSAQAASLPSGETDREGAMAKADLYKLANYSHKLFQQIQDEDQLEGWVQAKITKAADYIASVYHYLEYEMKFSEYGKALDDSDVLSEGQKRVLKTRLMEAKTKVKELKKAQAEKVNDKKVEEGVISGGHTACAECGGSGMVYEEPKAIPDHVRAKVDKYKRQATAFHAAGKRIDANKNGIPDEDELGEEASSTGGEIDRSKKGVTKHKQNPNRFSDEPHTEPKSQAKAQSAKDKEGDKAADKAEEKEGKNWEKEHGKGSVTRVKDGKKVNEEKSSTGGEIDRSKKGVVKHTQDTKKFSDEPHTEPKSQAKAQSAADKAGDKAADKAEEKEGKAWEKTHGKGSVTRVKDGKKVDEALKGGQKKLDTDSDEDIDAKDLAALRARKKVKEAAPSAGLSAAKKSVVVKKAKAGGDIGKPGKNFDKVAKAAEKGGAKDGAKVAAAAMWKNMKESVKVEEAEKKAKRDYDEDGKIETGAEEHAGSVDKAIKAKAKETVKESADMTRMKEFLTRLNG
jgi:hypothetical protein